MPQTERKQSAKAASQHQFFPAITRKRANRA